MSPLATLHSLLSPRLTPSYILLTTTALFFLSRLLHNKPLLSSRLPRYTGPHNVGTIDIEVPVSRRREIGSHTFSATGAPAFKLKTVLFTLYYPSTSSASGKRHTWIPPPLPLRAEGYARLARISNTVTNFLFTVLLWAVAGRTIIPAAVDAPLLSPDEKRGKWPVVIFSHGMASSRADYTAWCGEMASRGAVVAVLEHRDGSCPGSVVMSGGGEEKVLWFNEGHLRETDGSRGGVTREELKVAQLAFRQAEVEEVVRVMKMLNEGEGEEVRTANTRAEGRALQDWKGKLDAENMTVAGHSYGATLALQTLKGGPSVERPFFGAIVLDPGKHSGQLNDDIQVPVLIVHSQSWSKSVSIFFGRPHFDVVRELAEGVLKRGKKAWFMTSLGTSHPSITDAPLLEPFLLSWTTGSTIDALEGVQQYVQVSSEFLKYQHEGKITGLLARPVDSPQYEGTLKLAIDALQGSAKYWQVHVAP